MSVINPEVHRNKDENIVNGQIVELFEIYTQNTYGSAFWEEFRSSDKINQVYDKYYTLFGDSIFSILVDNLSLQVEKSVKEILSDFGQFIKTYY